MAMVLRLTIITPETSATAAGRRSRRSLAVRYAASPVHSRLSIPSSQGRWSRPRISRR